jgi:hypothetical protein
MLTSNLSKWEASSGQNEGSVGLENDELLCRLFSLPNSIGLPALRYILGVFGTREIHDVGSQLRLQDQEREGGMVTKETHSQERPEVLLTHYFSKIAGS